MDMKSMKICIDVKSMKIVCQPEYIKWCFYMNYSRNMNRCLDNALFVSLGKFVNCVTMSNLSEFCNYLATMIVAYRYHNYVSGL